MSEVAKERFGRFGGRERPPLGRYGPAGESSAADGRRGEVLQFSPADIVANARRHGPGGRLVSLWLRQRIRERKLRRQKRVEFRSPDNGNARHAYAAMGVDEFTDINLLQAWSDWRTIPRCLSGRLPDRPARAIDLCCGVGESTSVLAFYYPAGSRLLGLDSNPSFVEVARGRPYRCLDGSPARVSFYVQSVLESFRDAEGRVLDETSIDAVNASGAVGCHFRPEATELIAKECARVMRPGGLAMLDSGREGTGPEELAAIFAKLGFRLSGRTRSCALDRHWQLCFKKGE